MTAGRLNPTDLQADHSKTIAPAWPRHNQQTKSELTAVICVWRQSIHVRCPVQPCLRTERIARLMIRTGGVWQRVAEDVCC